MEVLQKEVRSLPKVFVVADALDECSQSNDKRDQLLEVEKLNPAHILITSRPHITEIPEYFEAISSLEILATPDDIKVYVDEAPLQSFCVLRLIHPGFFSAATR